MFLYDNKNGDFPSRSFAKVLLVLRGSDSSVLLILGAVSLMILFGTLLSRYLCTSVKCRVDDFYVVVNFYFRNCVGVSFNF